MLSEEIQIEKMLKGLFFYIMQLELCRCPVLMGVGSYPWSMIFRLLFTDKKNYFVKNNLDLYQKTHTILDDYYKDNLEDDDKYNKRQSLYLYLYFGFVLALFWEQ